MTNPTRLDRPLTMLVCALGGEGGGVLSEWLVDTATRCGYAAQSTSIPGVAQRTGSTTYYIEIAREPQTDAAPAPVFSLYPVPGTLDVLVASELLEATRQVAAGTVSPERTRVIASSERTLTTFEKMQLADGRASDEALIGVLRRYSRVLDVVRMSEIAAENGAAISSVMFGAIAASGVLPFERKAFEATIRDSGKSVESNLVGFARGYAAIDGGRVPAPLPRATPPQASALPADVAQRFPADTHAMLAAGYSRLLAFQDEVYARLYVDRLTRVLAAENALDPAASGAHAVTRETARYLAAWMAFDDIARVAELKSRRSRLERVRREVRAGDADVVRVYDHFKPGVAEIAAMLPARLAESLLRWDRRRIAAGKRTFAIAVKLRSHSVHGLAALRIIGAFKRLRRWGSRYADEQAGIEHWLSALQRALASDWRLAHEIALCGRLIKGYGATNARGKDNLRHVLEHLGDDARATADAIRAVRDAALADDAGTALDRALVQHGAPARPPKVQPVVWVRPPKGAAAREASAINR